MQDPEVHTKFPLFQEAKFLEVTVSEGDVFYLPFGWYHLVTGGDGINITVNHWFGMKGPKQRSVMDPSVDLTYM